MIEVLFWWSVLGVIPYQLTVLKVWYKTKPNVVRVYDILNAIPFGLIILLSVTITYLIFKIKNKE